MKNPSFLVGSIFNNCGMAFENKRKGSCVLGNFSITGTGSCDFIKKSISQW